MIQDLKQRLIGGLVVLVVLAIFMPIILQKPTTIDDHLISLPHPLPQKNSQLSIQIPAVPHKRSPVNVQPVKKLAAAAASKAHWVIKVGTFGEIAHVTALEKQLSKLTLPVYTQQIRVQDKTLTQVFIGPVKKRTSLQPLQRQLKAIWHIDTIITRT